MLTSLNENETHTVPGEDDVGDDEQTHNVPGQIDESGVGGGEDATSPADVLVVDVGTHVQRVCAGVRASAVRRSEPVDLPEESIRVGR